MKPLLLVLLCMLGVCGAAFAEDAAKPAPAQADAPVLVPDPSPLAMQYYRTGNILWIVGQVFSIAVPALILFTGLSARMRTKAQRVGEYWTKFVKFLGSILNRNIPEIEIVGKGLAFLEGSWLVVVAVYFAFYTLLTFLIELPLSYYREFVRPHAYGLSAQTFQKWAVDTSIELLLMLAIGAALLWIPYLLIKKSPRRWWFYTGLLAIPFMCLAMLIAPIYIAPLFNTFGPMNDKALEARILALADRAHIEDARVFEVDKSQDTKTVNAYVTGFMDSKRIVLWDTLLQKLDPEETLVVMGHEMGHYVLNHVTWSLTFSSILIFLVLYLIYRISGGIIARHRDRIGFAALDDVASLPLIILIAGILTFLIEPVALAYSRHHEHEADRFALEITHDNHAAAAAFVKLQTENLANPRPGLLFKLWRGSHPSIGERIDFMNSYHPWRDGVPGRYDGYFKPAANN